MPLLIENAIFIIATLAIGGLIVARATVLPIQHAPPQTAARTSASVPASTPAPTTIQTTTPAPSVPIHAIRGVENEGFGGFDD